MQQTDFAKKVVTFCLISTIFTISIFSGLLKTKADSTQVFLQWEGNDVGVGGYLTIADFPEALEIGKTYKITATFTLEKLDYADAVEFGGVEWALSTQDGNYTIGYSSLDANLTKHQENSTISHWAISGKPTTGGGILTAVATIKLHNCTDPDKATQTISIKPPSTELLFKVESQLQLNIVNPKSYYVLQGQAIIFNGTLTSNQGGATITINNEPIPAFYRSLVNIVFTDPDGNEIVRPTTVDRYGQFAYELALNSTGTWFAKANYNGSSYFFPSTSNIVVIRVDYQFPWVTLIGFVALLSLIATPFLLKWANKAYRYENSNKSRSAQKS